jgi:hypothetical protein
MAPKDQLSPEQLAALAKDDLGQLTKNIIIAFTIISFVSVCLRMYTRIRYQAVGWEDYSIVFAMVRNLDNMMQYTCSQGHHRFLRSRQVYAKFYVRDPLKLQDAIILLIPYRG